VHRDDTQASVGWRAVKPGSGGLPVALHSRRYQQLPYVTLRVLGGVEEETQHSGRQLCPSHSARVIQCPFVRSTQLHQRMLYLLAKRTNQIMGGGCRSRCLSFRRERLPLSGGKCLSASVCEEAVEHSGEMLEMKSDGSDTSRSGPKQIIGESLQQRLHLLTSLQQRVCDRLKQRRHIGNGSAKPRFGLRLCHATYPAFQ
jgi:hypothetical protein